MLHKTNHAGYEKDISSNLVINNNKNEYLLHMQNKEKAKEFQRMSRDIEALKDQVLKLTGMVQQILSSQETNG